MIGTLLCYVLFPLARVTRSVSDRRRKHGSWKAEPCCSVMNGNEVWDGGCPATQRPSEEQNSWQLSTGASSCEEEEVGGGPAQGDECEVVVFPKSGDTQDVEEDRIALREVVQEDDIVLSTGRGPDSGIKEEEQEELLEPTRMIGIECLQKGRVFSEEEHGREGETWDEEAAWGGPGGLDSTGPVYHMPLSRGSGPVSDVSDGLLETSSWAWTDYVQMSSIGWHFPTGPGLDQVIHCPPIMTYTAVVQEMAPFEVNWRVWEDLSNPQESVQAPQASFEFTVMSYNILAQDLLETNLDLYSHCTPDVLAWDFRFRNILLEFEKWKPDIICLQEVQESHYIKDLLPVLTALGYGCVYKRRTGTKTDGCAVCYQKCRFSQVSARLVEFRRPELTLLNRDNIAVVLLLQPRGRRGSEVVTQGPPICVANTHLLFSPRRGDVKLAQLAVLLAEIDYAVKPYRLSGSPCPIILCGDFNAIPDMPLYQLITTGQLYYHGLPAWMISGQEDLSYKVHHHFLCAPLWPSELGINNNCQYVSDSERNLEGVSLVREGPVLSRCQSSAEGDPSRPLLAPGRIQYSHSFLRQFRFCEASCVRPPDLDVIRGVTDATPDPLLEKQWDAPRRFGNVLCHGLQLRSAYSHYMSGTSRPEVTTLHSDFAATVDYIFYSAGPASCARQRGDGPQQDGSLKLIGRLTLLSEDVLWPMKGLPNKIFSSDHLCLLAKFQLGPDHL